MNREYELINYLKQPVRQTEPKRWNRCIPFQVRFVYKAYGGRGRGRWIVFKDKELPMHKGFSDALVATLVAHNLLTPFCQENDRGFFLKECVEPYIGERKYVYKSFDEIKTYKRV